MECVRVCFMINVWLNCACYASVTVIKTEKTELQTEERERERERERDCQFSEQSYRVLVIGDALRPVLQLVLLACLANSIKAGLASHSWTRRPTA